AQDDFRHRGSRRGWGDRPRMRRGQIRFILLELLSERPQHGYDLLKGLESGFRRLSPGSVYPTLQMLEEGGYLTSEQVDDKRVYTITDSGRQLLSARHQQGEPYDRAMRNQPPAELNELRKSMTEVDEAVALVARSGNTEQINRVREFLVELKREIYKMLAE
ncbi:MAG: PadR family transcriptional regulator, partial [Microcystaceae cyanobacterium]